MAKSQRGEFKVEFYTHLPLIKERFENGVVVAKILYNELYDAKKITMSYERFAAYFQKEFKNKNEERITPKKEAASNSTLNPSINNDLDVENEPMILTVGGKKGENFNPHTREINPDDIIGGRKKNNLKD